MQCPSANIHGFKCPAGKYGFGGADGSGVGDEKGWRGKDEDDVKQ